MMVMVEDLRFSCPVLSASQVVTGAHRGACAQDHTPGCWQMQEGRTGCPQKCLGCGEGKLARSSPRLSSLREAEGLGPSPVISRCTIYGSVSPSLSLLVCKLGVVMAPTSQPWGRQAQSCAGVNVASVRIITIVTASSYHEYSEFGLWTSPPIIPSHSVTLCL